MAIKDSQVLEAPRRGFSQAEFELRMIRAQDLMSRSRLDAMLLTTEANFRYFTGFHSQFWESPTRPWFAVVPFEGKPIAVIPEIGAVGMASTWVEEIKTWPSPRPKDDGISLLAETLSTLATRFARVGVMLGHESHLRMPVGDFMRLRYLLSAKEIVDCNPLMKTLRDIKSAEEIAKIRYACQLTSSGFEDLPTLLRVGETERQNCQRFRIDLLKRGADHIPYLVAASGQGGYDNIIMGPTDRVLEAGDIMVIDTGTIYDGYFCDFDRNFAFVHADDTSRRAYDVIYQATEAGFEMAKPGNTTSDLWHAMWNVLEKGGALSNDVGRLGHGLGMQLTEPPSITPTDNTLLQPGMVITLEPGMTFAPGKQMVHEENIVITEEGAELLTRRASPQLPIVG